MPNEILRILSTPGSASDQPAFTVKPV